MSSPDDFEHVTKYYYDHPNKFRIKNFQNERDLSGYRLVVDMPEDLIRMKKIINDSHEMLYLISMLSTTGGKLKVSPKTILKNYNKIKKIIKAKGKNLVIGFGITSKNIASFKTSDGCVVGSEICKKISKSIKNRQNPVTNVCTMVKKLKSKII